MDLAPIESLLKSRRYETARRRCLHAMKWTASPPSALLALLHEALHWLGDPDGCRQVLTQLSGGDDDARFEAALRAARDARRFAESSYYRVSAEARQGLTHEEYIDRMQAQEQARLEEASDLATTPGQRARLDQHQQPQRAGQALAPTAAPRHDVGAIRGRLRWPGGEPAARLDLVLGLHVPVAVPDAATYLQSHMHCQPRIGEARVMRTRTDDQGRFHLHDVPAGRQAYLAVQLDPQAHAIACRFVAQDIEVRAGDATELDLVLEDWSSSPPQASPPLPPEQMTWQDRRWRRVGAALLDNPFHYAFPRQPLPVPLEDSADASTLAAFDTSRPGEPMLLQVIDGQAWVMADLPALTRKHIVVYRSQSGDAPTVASRLRCDTSDAGALVLHTGSASFRLPPLQPTSPTPPASPPIEQVAGLDGRWMGQGRWNLPADLTLRHERTQLLEAGPLRAVVQVDYRLSDGQPLSFRMTTWEGEPTLLVEERSSLVGEALSPGERLGAFEFSLRSFAQQGGRGYLHWKAQDGGHCWHALRSADELLALLPESVAWWIPPHGFGYAMTPDGPGGDEPFVAVFTLRRGEWDDAAFARVAQGPGDDRREWDWPYPEMIGSPLSAITAHSAADGDAFFRWRCFEGGRQWGILVSDLSCNDGPTKQLSEVQHKHSSPRLMDFVQWRLDEQDRVARPGVMAPREELIAMRRRAKLAVFARAAEHVINDDSRPAMRFLLRNDPVDAWAVKLELVHVAAIRCRMTLLGREFSDMYSPVGARPITRWAQDFDMVAASGVFTPDEERLVRRFLMLMGHLYESPDLMNWRYNSRNANFEADRVDVVGTVGLVFRGNPDADAMIAHAIEQTRSALRVYCTPGSGKWYENPACYYLHAMKCRLNLILSLAYLGLLDPREVDRLDVLLGWGVKLLTPPGPQDYDAWNRGLDGDAWVTEEKVRRIAPIGDHAVLGPAIPEHFLLIARFYAGHDPALRDTLVWAWHACGSDGGVHGDAALLLARATEEDLMPPPAPPPLHSGRLPGFGAVLRDRVGETDEFYLLLKLGPGGYRYHRTEGSVILFARGVPLIYDGGEGGETWRHSTLSFGDTHMPPAAGHMERIVRLGNADLLQGVNPVALQPGDAIFLNDRCDPHLIDLAQRRFHEPRPAISRSVMRFGQDYVLLHDELDLNADQLTHWHLQVVAHEGQALDDRTFHFRGRFGVDLRVVMAERFGDRATIERLPLRERPPHEDRPFAMQHLCLTGRSPRRIAAVLQPMSPGQTPLAVVGDESRIDVRGRVLHDTLLLARVGRRVEAEGLRFDGRYAAVLRRERGVTLLLFDGRELAAGDWRIVSDGVQASLGIEPDRLILHAQGPGRLAITGPGFKRDWQLDDQPLAQTLAGSPTTAINDA